MNVRILNSGSDGNCTILTDNKNNQLICDCGLNYKKIFPFLHLELLDAICLSHIHPIQTIARV